MYATQQDLVDRFGEKEVLELSDRTNTGAIDATVVARALADADAQIDSYLQARYALPLSAVPTVIARIAADLARYYLYDDKATDQVTKRYNDAVKFLQSVASGEVSIGVDGANAQPNGASDVRVQANDRVFTRGSDAQGTTGTLDDFIG